MCAKHGLDELRRAASLRHQPLAQAVLKLTSSTETRRCGSDHCIYPPTSPPFVTALQLSQASHYVKPSLKLKPFRKRQGLQLQPSCGRGREGGRCWAPAAPALPCPRLLLEGPGGELRTPRISADLTFGVPGSGARVFTQLHASTA